MSDGKDHESGQDQAKARLSLRPAGRLELGRTVDAGSVKQSFSHGRTKTVQVEVRKSRPSTVVPGRPAAPVAPPRGASPAAVAEGRSAPAPATATATGAAHIAERHATHGAGTTSAHGAALNVSHSASAAAPTARAATPAPGAAAR